MLQSEALSIIAKSIDGCCKCDLHKTRTHTVPGEGHPNAEIMIIGEGPGKQEDETGRPFVGRAGQLLDNILNALGWQRNSVYICNIVKCRPPDNRTPTDQEALSCSSYLDAQIKIVNPNYIICLGSVAAKHLLKKNDTITSLRGKLHDYRGKKVLATYHPSYLLRNPSAKKDVWEDLKILLGELNKLEQT